MEIKANVSLSRDSRNVVTIEIQDEKSRSKFVKVSLTLENFALMMTGLAHVECDGEVRNLEAVGKNKVSEARKIEVPSELGYDRSLIENYIREKLSRRRLANQCNADFSTVYS